MNLYTLALFLHVSGAVSLFAGLGGMLFGMMALRRTQSVEQARVLATLMAATGNLAAVGIVILGVAGFYMAWTVWGIHATWIIVATVSFVLLAPGGLLVIDPRVRDIAKQARAIPDGPLPEALAARTRDPVLGAGLIVYVACLFGIVFLMTNKPALAVSVEVMVIAVTTGMVASLPLWRASHTRKPRMTSPASSE